MSLRTLLLLPVLLVSALLLGHTALSQADEAGQLALVKLPLPPLPEQPSAADAETDPEFKARVAALQQKLDAALDEETRTTTAQKRKGEVLSSVLKRLGVDTQTIYRIAAVDKQHLLSRFVPGEKFEALYSHGALQLTRHISKTTQVVAKKTATGWSIEKITLPVELHTASAAGTIKDSLYLSGKNAGLSDKVIISLANLYQWEIDFARQLRPGDRFKVLYEKKYLNGEYIGDGRIIAAEVITRDGAHKAFLLTDKQGNTIGYYDEKGHNLRKAFMRNPVDFVRITSGFTHKRWHPIQHRWKAHRGVDYGGKIGTPVHVTGNGRITFRGWKQGYGRVVFVKHGHKYTTVYAHLSRFGKYKKDDYVKQGQIIGYIGQSGWASGPHLHYEFRINGQHVDPLSVRFPDASPVPRKYRAQFAQRVRLLDSQLGRLQQTYNLASNFE